MVHPILSALRRHKAGVVLIALQIALTLAIVSNALFIIGQRLARLSRPTGVAESGLLTVQNSWIGMDDAQAVALSRADLLALRQLPGVEDAALSSSFPIQGGGWDSMIRLDPDLASTRGMARVIQYFGDDQVLPTLGARLVAGRNFRPDEVAVADRNELTAPPVVILSKTLADRLYPDGAALGKPVYLSSYVKPSTVIGIVERLQGGRTAANQDGYTYDTVLQPVQLSNYDNVYLIRARPGQLAAVAAAVPRLLYRLSRQRYIPAGRGLRTFGEVRAQAYRNDRGLAMLMGVVCSVLLAITAAGIVGLTSFWVGQRRKQIGVRRALGATRGDILRYFFAENLLIATGGAVLGIVLALGLNLWLISRFEMARMPVGFVLAGVAIVLALGQAAVYMPARRASQVPPVVATRTV